MSSNKPTSAPQSGNSQSLRSSQLEAYSSEASSEPKTPSLGTLAAVAERIGTREREASETEYDSPPSKRARVTADPSNEEDVLNRGGGIHQGRTMPMGAFLGVREEGAIMGADQRRTEAYTGAFPPSYVQEPHAVPPFLHHRSLLGTTSVTPQTAPYQQLFYHNALMAATAAARTEQLRYKYLMHQMVAAGATEMSALPPLRSSIDSAPLLLGQLQQQGAIAQQGVDLQLQQLLAGVPPPILPRRAVGVADAHPREDAVLRTTIAQSAQSRAQQGSVPFVLTPTPPPNEQPVNRHLLYTECDEDVLADNQILLRRQLEFFDAGRDDINTYTSGRKKAIQLGQVGIRCIHCANVPVRLRKKGSVYYPSKLKGIYQAAQNMNSSHFCDSCDQIDPVTKARLILLHQERSTTGHGGKVYWAEQAQSIVETEDDGLRFEKAPSSHTSAE